MSLSLQVKSQELGKFDIKCGIERYPLGSERPPSDTLLKLVEGGKMAYKTWVEYIYQIPDVYHKNYRINGFGFSGIMLTYVNDTLMRLTINRIYTPKLFSDYKEAAKQDFKKVYQYLKEQWTDKGKKKIFIKSRDGLIVSNGYEWEMGGQVLKASLYEDKSSSPLALVEIVIELTKYK